MKTPPTRQLPFDPDQEQLKEMLRADIDGAVIASPGSDRHQLLDPLADQGLMTCVYCAKAMRVDQFQLTHKGREYLRKTA